MFRIVEGDTAGLADAEEFVDTLGALDRHPVEPARRLFDRAGDLIVARAPGRLDVMGGIADYSGSLVLQLPIREAALVALQESPERVLRIVSLGRERQSPPVRSFELPLSEFETGGSAAAYDAVRASLARDPNTHWASYVAGIFLVLMREQGVQFPRGARLLVDSRVPQGKGVSSSAALEVATLSAVAAWRDLKIEPREIALLCQKAENLVVGAPCGVMDQMTSACGKANRLLALLCQPAELHGHVPIPDGIVIAGLDSGVRHAVTGAAYSDVRTGAFMGYRIIAGLAKLKVHPSQRNGVVKIDDPEWRGYLANVPVTEFDKSFAPRLPEKLSGAEFLTRYRGTTDPVTHVHPDKKYAVKTPTRHPIHENFRVGTFAELLHAELDDSRMRALGELMYQSHASYSACGLGEPRTDLIVQMCRQAGPEHSVFGAKITGGGSGGTVALLASGSRGAIEQIAADYERETGYAPHQFWGSSPGAAEFGTLRLRSAA
ncbi:MAG TPA: galactokinase family protein [Candidatus Acidoferrales bacterium]|nr:galactokinase family protein [Candidatus Acidoferrales bacterium]